jgi:hypothetical protein
MDEARHQSFASAGFSAQKERRDMGVAERIESRQVTELHAETMDRGGLSNQAGGGMAR